MNTRLTTVLNSALLITILGIDVTLAAQDQMALALAQALAAVESANKGDATAVEQHAIAAKTHLEVVQRNRTNVQIDVGIEKLSDTIQLAGKGKSKLAGKAATEAVAQLQKVKLNP